MSYNILLRTTWASRRWSLGLLVLLFAGAGILHFVHRDSFEQMVPPWLPHPALLVAISGIAEVLGAVGLLRARTRAAAGWGLIALLVAVFPANVHMLADARSRGASALWQTTLWVRLPLQVVLIWWVWRAAIGTRNGHARATIGA